MAISRCKKCGKPTARVKPPGYADSPYMPVSYPESGIVCGKPGCEEPGLIWLKRNEEKEYQLGKRVFGIHTQTAKVRVQ